MLILFIIILGFSILIATLIWTRAIFQKTVELNFIVTFYNN